MEDKRRGVIYKTLEMLKVEQVGHKRPSLKSPINGLWHTGHWTKPGGGIYGVIVSGRKVAQMVLGYRNATDFVKAINRGRRFKNKLYWRYATKNTTNDIWNCTPYNCRRYR